MADYYTNSSFMVYGNVNETNLLHDMIVEADVKAEEEEESTTGAEIKVENNGLWIRDNGEYINVEALSSIIQEWLIRIESDKVVGFEWSQTCNKPRLDSFGGGAIVITKDSVQWTNTSTWLENEISRAGG